MPAFHETLRRRREEVRMGEGRASQLLGLTTMGYYDLDAYEEEWRTVVPLYITMFACRVFEIDMLQFVPDQTGVAVGPNALAGDVIKERRGDRVTCGDPCGSVPICTGLHVNCRSRRADFVPI
jgi:hypothetical protein